MKVVFKREELLNALIPCSGVVPGRANSNGLDGVLMECPGVEPGTCRLSVYDLDRGLRTSIDAKIMTEGKYILNTQKLVQIVRAFPDDEIMITVNENLRVTISAGSGSFEISALPGENFPMLPNLNGDRNYTMPQHEFRDLVSRTIYAAATADPQRVQCNGVYFRMRDGKMTIVACDGFKLAVNEADSPDGSPDASFLVPTKILLELLKMVKDSEDEITVSLARKHVIFKMGEHNFFARLIEAEYFNYVKMVERARDYLTEVFIDKAWLTGAVERAQLIAEDKLGGNYRAFVKMEFGEDLLKISCATQSGSVYEEIPCAMNGEGLIIGFNCRRFLETLRAIPDDVYTVRLRMTTALQGAIVEEARGSGFDFAAPDGVIPDGVSLPDDPERKKFLYYVMPVSMNG